MREDMSDWQHRPAGAPQGQPGTGPENDNLWPRDALNAAGPDATDPFSSVRPIGGGLTHAYASAPVGEPTDPLDPLDPLKREAEAALRDPAYVSAYARSRPGAARAVAAELDPQPAQTLTSQAGSAASLFDMLDGSNREAAMFGPLAPVEAHPFFAVPHAPDVLRLFAGDIVPPQRRAVAAPLTRREHHLVSMDSAFRPAPAQAQERGDDA